MNNYSYFTTPATAGVFAGLIMLGASGIDNQPQVAPMDRITPITSSIIPATNTNGYLELGGSPTLSLAYEMAVGSADDALLKASQDFVRHMSTGLEVLGREYVEVMEESFWDLVVR